MSTTFHDEDTDAEVPASAVHNIQAEQELLGAIILHRGAFSAVDLIITTEDFYEPLHRSIYAKLPFDP